MAAYTTKAEVRVATGFSNTTNITDTTLDQYIADASSVIDSKIYSVYTLPLPVVPEIIETICRIITVALLYMDEYGEESENLDKGWKNRLDWAMKLLDDIQSLKIKLVDPGTGIELPRSTLLQPAYYPNDVSSALDAPDSTAPKFTMNQKF